MFSGEHGHDRAVILKSDFIHRLRAHIDFPRRDDNWLPKLSIFSIIYRVANPFTPPFAGGPAQNCIPMVVICEIRTACDTPGQYDWFEHFDLTFLPTSSYR
jgi:hypothetical protein